MFLYQITFKSINEWIHLVDLSYFPFLQPLSSLFPPRLLWNKENQTRDEVPHRLRWTSRISIHPVLSFSALAPALTHPHCSTLPRTPVSPALSALWGICISNRSNSHSVSPSHLPLVTEWSVYRPPSSSTRFSCSPRTWQPRMRSPIF